MRFGMNTTTRIPKLFLTAQTVNPPRFPLHVPNESITDKHRINIQIFCRKLRFRCQRLCALFSASKIKSGTQFHGCTDLSTLCRDNSHTHLPLPQILFFVISQILGDTWPAFSRFSLSLSLRRVGRREPWERGWLPIWFPIRCPLKEIVYGSWKVLKICLRASKRWLILSNSVRCCENFWSLGRCFDLCVDKHKRAFSLVEKCHVTSWPCP